MGALWSILWLRKVPEFIRFHYAGAANQHCSYSRGLIVPVLASPQVLSRVTPPRIRSMLQEENLLGNSMGWICSSILLRLVVKSCSYLVPSAFQARQVCFAAEASVFNMA
jgi:hypothetical protein